MIAAGEGCDLKKRIIRPDGVQRVDPLRWYAGPRKMESLLGFVGTRWTSLSRKN